MTRYGTLRTWAIFVSTRGIALGQALAANCGHRRRGTSELSNYEPVAAEARPA